MCMGKRDDNRARTKSWVLIRNAEPLSKIVEFFVHFGRSSHVKMKDKMLYRKFTLQVRISLFPFRTNNNKTHDSRIALDQFGGR